MYCVCIGHTAAYIVYIMFYTYMYALQCRNITGIIISFWPKRLVLITIAVLLMINIIVHLNIVFFSVYSCLVWLNGYQIDCTLFVIYSYVKNCMQYRWDKCARFLIIIITSFYYTYINIYEHESLLIIISGGVYQFCNG